MRIGNNNKVTSKRTQFPLVHAWGVTIHKEQGKTEDKLVLSCKESFNAGQFYTAISRTKDLDGLFLLDEVTSAKIKVNNIFGRNLQNGIRIPFCFNGSHNIYNANGNLHQTEHTQY